MKKEKFNYYNEFITNINYTLESAQILNDYISDFDSTKSAKKEEMVHNLENEADKSLHNILNYLVKDFIPPIDREDIIQISNSIDDLEDCIDDVVIKINIYKITKLRQVFSGESDSLKMSYTLKSKKINLSNIDILTYRFSKIMQK